MIGALSAHTTTFSHAHARQFVVSTRSSFQVPGRLGIESSALELWMRSNLDTQILLPIRDKTGGYSIQDTQAKEHLPNRLATTATSTLPCQPCTDKLSNHSTSNALHLRTFLFWPRSVYILWLRARPCSTAKTTSVSASILQSPPPLHPGLLTTTCGHLRTAVS